MLRARSLTDKMERKPFGSIGKMIGGQRIPLRDGASDSERLDALENAVRGIADSLDYLAPEIERLGNEVQRQAARRR